MTVNERLDLELYPPPEDEDPRCQCFHLGGLCGVHYNDGLLDLMWSEIIRLRKLVSVDDGGYKPSETNMTTRGLIDKLKAEAGVWDTVNEKNGSYSTVYNGKPLADLLRRAARELEGLQERIQRCRHLEDEGIRASMEAP